MEEEHIIQNVGSLLFLFAYILAYVLLSRKNKQEEEIAKRFEIEQIYWPCTFRYTKWISGLLMTTKGYAKHPCYKLLIHKDSQWFIYNATHVNRNNHVNTELNDIQSFKCQNNAKC